MVIWIGSSYEEDHYGREYGKFSYWTDIFYGYEENHNEIPDDENHSCFQNNLEGDYS